VNLAYNVLPENPLGAHSALLLSHGSSLGIPLDEVSLLLLGYN
jgi:hypothetical protein